MYVLQFRLIGKSSLLMHNPRSMLSENGSMKKRVPTAEEEAEMSAYRLPDNSLYVPTLAIRNSMLIGSGGLRINKKAARPQLAGAVLPSDMAFPLVDDQGSPITKYAIDLQRAVVQGAGIIRARARVDLPWNLVCSFALNADTDREAETFVAVANEALRYAGTSVGLLDYRPAKSGWYGTFEHAEMRALKA